MSVQVYINKYVMKFRSVLQAILGNNNELTNGEMVKFVERCQCDMTRSEENKVDDEWKRREKAGRARG